MSAVIAADAAAAPAPAKAGTKKLFMLIAIAMVVLLAIGGGAAFYLKHRAAAQAAAEAADDDGAEHAAAKIDPKAVPVFLPLDPFVVNLADKEADRFAQIGITLELEDAHAVDQIKNYMPAIRNGILLLIASKSSHDLTDRAGKEQLAREILRESMRPMGIEVAEPEAPTATGEASSAAGKQAAASADAEDDAVDDDAGAKAKAKARAKAKAKAKAKPKAHGEAEHTPVRRVNFSSFIIQ